MIGFLGSGGINLLPDSTFFYQLGIFLACVAILHHLILKPALRVLSRRAEATGGAWRKAESLEDEARRMEATATTRLNQARGESTGLEELKRREVEAYAKGIIENARVKAAALLEEEHRALALLKEEAEQKLERDVPQFATMIFHRLLKTEAGKGAT